MKTKYVIILIAILFCSKTVTATNWLNNLEDAKKLAIATNKLVLLDFWAPWCGPCLTMDREAWSNPEISELTKNYVPVKLNFDSNLNLAKQFDIVSIPFVFILDGNGKIVHQHRGYRGKAEVIKMLKTYALNTAYLNAELSNYHKKKNYVTSFRLAEKYLNFSLHLNENVRGTVVNLANSYFQEALKHLKKSQFSNKNKKSFKQRIALYNIERQIIIGHSKKALKQLLKLKESTITDTNKQFFWLLHYTVLKKLDNSDEANKLKNKLNAGDIKKAELLLSI